MCSCLQKRLSPAYETPPDGAASLVQGRAAEADQRVSGLALQVVGGKEVHPSRLGGGVRTLLYQLTGHFTRPLEVRAVTGRRISMGQAREHRSTHAGCPSLTRT